MAIIIAEIQEGFMVKDFLVILGIIIDKTAKANVHKNIYTV